MLRTTLLAMVIMAVSLAFAVPAAPAAPAGPQDPKCAAGSATLSGGAWDVVCGSESACGPNTLCLRTLGRDVFGDFYVCRCNGGQISRCCQLVLRASTRLPEARGGCTDCGETGICSMKLLNATTYKADCRVGGSERW